MFFREYHNYFTSTAEYLISAFCRTSEINMLFWRKKRWIFCLLHFFNFRQVLDSASLTTCLDIVLWLLALNELKKIVTILTNLFYNCKTKKQDITIVIIFNDLFIK